MFLLALIGSMGSYAFEHLSAFKTFQFRSMHSKSACIQSGSKYTNSVKFTSRISNKCDIMM